MKAGNKKAEPAEKQEKAEKKKRQSKYTEKVTLAPMSFGEAMSLAVKTKVK